MTTATLTELQTERALIPALLSRRLEGLQITLTGEKHYDNQ